MKFETDACGLLQRVENSHSRVRQGSYPDDLDGDPDQPPSDLGREMVERWLSEHVEIAVVNDGVQKSCDDEHFDGRNDLPQFQALQPTMNSIPARGESAPGYA